MIVKTLTLTQPWASLVAIGAKQIESRSWNTHYRGPLLIHAAKTFPPAARALLKQEPFFSLRYQLYCDGEEFTLYPPRLGELPLGHIVAVCRLVDCRETSGAKNEFGSGPKYADWVHQLKPLERAFGDYGEERFGWFLDDVRPLVSPIAAKGALSLWNFDTAGHAELERLLL